MIGPHILVIIILWMYMREDNQLSIKYTLLYEKWFQQLSMAFFFKFVKKTPSDHTVGV